ncbi:MAG: signal peptide peptidase SppA [Phycisphaeraceae bacterium]|nr:signal peptide peptidase SppA [Phycisphaeraceae bacterium]
MRRLPALLACLLALVGCSPLSFTVSLDGSGGRLNEQTALTDPGSPAPKVALIDLTGLIADRPRFSLLGRGENPVDEFLLRLDRAAADPAVRAVVVRINSPGGSVTASDVLHAELRRFADETGKPVVASLGEVAASGGYYVALAADEIVAHPTAITGSIGVIIPTVNVSQGLAKIGIHSRSVTSGPNKDLANPLEPPREQHYAILQGMVDEFYERFRALVVERRPALDASRLDAMTDGRIFSGREAVAAGLADTEGDVRDAFDAAKRLAGLDRARLVKYGYARKGTPATAYSLADAPPSPASAPAPTGERPGVSLVQLNLGAGLAAEVEPGRPYYLWLPEFP